MSVLNLTHRIFRIIQLVFIAIVFGLAGALIEQQVFGGTPTRVNYSIFVAAFAGLCLFYLIPASFFPTIRQPMVMVALDALITLFLFCAGIAMAASMGGKSCSNRYFLVNNGITNGGGSRHMRRRCMEANALTAFEWFAFAAFAVTLVLGIDELRRDTAGRKLVRRNARAAEV